MADIEPCPSCGALPIDWATDPHAKMAPLDLQKAARLVDPDAWHEALPTDGCGTYWLARRNKALAKVEAILALVAPGDARL